jgi:hypothetical protein
VVRLEDSLSHSVGGGQIVAGCGAASDMAPTANAGQFWSMRAEKQSFTSAKSPEPIGIAAHP